MSDIKLKIIGFLIGATLMFVLFNVFVVLYLNLDNSILSVIIPIAILLSVIIPLTSQPWEMKKLSKSFLFWLLVTFILFVITIFWNNLFSSEMPQYKNNYDSLGYNLTFVVYFQMIVIIVKLFHEKLK